MRLCTASISAITSGDKVRSMESMLEISVSIVVAPIRDEVTKGCCSVKAMAIWLGASPWRRAMSR